MPTDGREPPALNETGLPCVATRSSPASAFNASDRVVVTVLVAVAVAVPSETVSVTVNVPARV